jgi:hypothetical protein
MAVPTGDPDGLGEFQREFRRDPGLHATMIVVSAVFCVLLLTGIAWLTMPTASRA